MLGNYRGREFRLVPALLIENKPEHAFTPRAFYLLTLLSEEEEEEEEYAMRVYQCLCLLERDSKRQRCPDCKKFILFKGLLNLKGYIRPKKRRRRKLEPAISQSRLYVFITVPNTERTTITAGVATLLDRMSVLIFLIR